jgi:hypothetical protein
VDHHQPLDDNRLGRIGVEAHVPDDQRAAEGQRQSDERRNERLGFEQAPAPPLPALRRLLKPLLVSFVDDGRGRSK